MLEFSPHLVEGSEALYLQLYRYFCAEIQSRRLPSGMRLPSVRALSQHLRVSKTTVETAYHQLLAEGYLESRERSGFYVVDVEWDEPVTTGRRRPVPPASSGQDGTCLVSAPAKKIRYDFHQARVDAEHFPFDIWRRYSNQCMQQENSGVLYYGDRQGELVLREEIARYLRQARGVQAAAEQVVIGAGTQTMITLLGFLFGLRGQMVAMEDPGYHGVRTVFQQLGFQVQPIPLEEDGIDVEALGKSGARLVYITPSHQDPTGIVMPYAKRLKLLQWAKRTGSYIMEDDYDGEFRYNGRPIPSLQGLDTEGRVIYLGTFSKALLPTIRISYMVLPPPLLAVFKEKLQDFDQSASRVHQETLALFMKNGDWARHIRKMRTLYRKKHEVLLNVLQQELGEHIRIMGQDAGMSVTVEVRSAYSSAQLAQLAEAAGIRVHPACHKWLIPAPDRLPSFQLGFGGQSAEDIEAGIRLLAQTWRPYLSGE
ncbi:PLP-dependent aminotransferase family protein [Brevibacillus sp. GCM10020057]|uniref:MocR-like pyridoxine biosynthesis transcription factor PdxR n=1 Tax=Brevibacillus sp. GCM10020057 TaxID=3317327 RepID=UPI00362BF941